MIGSLKEVKEPILIKGYGHFILGHSWEGTVHGCPCWLMSIYDGGVSGRSLLLTSIYFSGIGIRSSLRMRMGEGEVLELLKKKMRYKMVV